MKVHHTIFRAQAIAAALISAPVASQQVQEKARIIIDRSVETQFSGIGELASETTFKDPATGTEQRSYGTGVLVSPCYIITSYHVVFGDNPKSFAETDNVMTFRIGTHPTAAFLGRTTAVPVIWGKRGVFLYNDWAIMRLKTCLGGHRFNFGYYEVEDDDQNMFSNRHIASLGFAGKDDRGLLSYGEGKIISYDKFSGFFKSNAPVVDGESGGPVFILDRGKMKLLGINTLGHKTYAGENPLKDPFWNWASDDEHRNMFLPVYSIINRIDIKIMLDRDKKSDGGINVLPETSCFLRYQTNC